MPGGNQTGPGGGGPWKWGYGGYGCWGPPWTAPWAGVYPYGGPPVYGCGFPPAGVPFQFAPPYSPEMEIEFLKQQADYLEEALAQVKKRLRELGET